MEQGIEWLRGAAAAGTVHTVRVTFADHLGVWRGKRVPVDLFLATGGSPLGFCDGMLVVDVHADLVQTTPYSNYQTGYPDVYVHPDLADVRPAGWAAGEAYVFGDLTDEHGHPADVAPRSALARVSGQAADLGGSAVVSGVRLALSGRLMHDPASPAAVELGLVPSPADAVLAATAAGLERSGIPIDMIEGGVEGGFTLVLAPLGLRDAGMAGVVVKSALKEMASAAGLEAIFMTRPTPSGPLATWTVEARVAGATARALASLPGLVADLRGLLAPSVTAFRAGPLPVAVSAADGGTDVRITASAEASPETVVACAVAAMIEATRGTSGGDDPSTLAEAAVRLETVAWPAGWLGEDLLTNSAPLLRAEQALFEAAVTDWELQRYWKAS